MARSFDEVKWKQAVARTDWYVRLYPELQRLQERWDDETDHEQAESMKHEVRDFFADGLEEGWVAIGTEGPNLDADRQPIDTVVIHHTSAEPGYRLPYMNATQMLNVYVPYFNDPTDENEKDLEGEPLWSNHVRDGRPVFYLYHWLMRMDGNFERLLEDHELGWHAANWEVNRRSVAICLDNDYEHQDPKPELLEKLARFIATTYPSVRPERILGHGEVSRKPTVCPGTNFEHAWKQQLTYLVGQAQQSAS